MKHNPWPKKRRHAAASNTWELNTPAVIPPVEESVLPPVKAPVPRAATSEKPLDKSKTKEYK
jgi:hypothetical protein